MKIKYPAELQKLVDMLDDACIPYEDDSDISKTKVFSLRNEKLTFSTYRIKYPQRKQFTASAIEGYGTYGFNAGLIELMMPADTEPVGWLSAEEVFIRIKKDWEERKNEK